MGLPSLATPQFTTTLPSTGQEIEYRPFLVKEEKVLMMALEGDDQKEIAKAVSNILKSCVLTDIDTNKISTFDFEHLFLQLRGKSVGEIIELRVGHKDDSECEHKTAVAINLDDVKVKGDIKDGKIWITDDVGVKMRYPSTSDLYLIDQTNESMFKLINSCIEYVFDKENIFNEFSEKELEDWVNGLNQNQFAKIAGFFEDMPKLSHDIEWKCEKCGKEEKLTVEGLQSFFT